MIVDTTIKGLQRRSWADGWLILQKRPSAEWHSSQRTTCELLDSFKLLTPEKPSLRKAQQRMFFLRQRKKFRVNKTILTQFHRAGPESVLTSSVTVWYGSDSFYSKNMLEDIVKTAWKIIGCKLPRLSELIYVTCTLRQSTTTVSDYTHSANRLFESLPAGKRFRSV